MAGFGGSLTIKVTWPLPGIAVLALRGELDVAVLDNVEGIFAETLANANRLVVDLGKTTFIDSYGIAAILHARRIANAVDCRVDFVIPAHSVVARALEIADVLSTLNRHRGR